MGRHVRSRAADKVARGASPLIDRRSCDPILNVDTSISFQGGEAAHTGRRRLEIGTHLDDPSGRTDLVSRGKQGFRKFRHVLFDGRTDPCHRKLGDGLRQNVIAEAIGVDTAALARSIDQLESLGLIERRVDPEDRRGRRLHLTEQGRSLAAELDVVAEDIRKHVLASVAAADGKAAIRVLQGLEQAAEEMLRRKR